jgi:hypothetical protein
MSHISTQKLSEMAGITKRHCQRLLIAGHVPDAVRTSGGHWSIPDNAKVRKWCKRMKAEKHQRPAVKMPAKRKAIEKLPTVPVGNELPQCLENLVMARKEMQHAIELARVNAERAGALLIAEYELNPGGKWRLWLVKNGYDASFVDLMNFARWCEKEGHDYLDSTILKKFGLIEKKPRASGGKVRSLMPQWITWTGKVIGQLSQIKASEIDDLQAEAIAQQLQPIVDFHKTITR